MVTDARVLPRPALAAEPCGNGRWGRTVPRTALQPLGGSDANLQRHGFSPRPPSISENVFLESVSVGAGTEPGVLEMEPYLGYPPESFPCAGPGAELHCDGLYGSAQRSPGGMQLAPGGQGDMEEGLLQPEFSLPPCQVNQHFMGAHAGTGTVAAAWDEPPHGTLEMCPGQPGVGAASGPHHHHPNTAYPLPGPCGQQPKLLSSCQDGGFSGGQRLQRLQIKSEQRYPAPAPALTPCQKPLQPPAPFGHAANAGAGGYPPEEPVPAGYMVSPGARRVQTPPMQSKDALVRSYVQAQQALLWGDALAPKGGEPAQCHAAQAPLYPSPRFCGYQTKPDPPPALGEPQHLLHAPSFSPGMVPHPPGGPKAPGHQDSLNYGGSLAPPGRSCEGPEASSRCALRLPPARCPPEGPGDALLHYPGHGTPAPAGKGGHKALGPAAASCRGPGRYGGSLEGLRGSSCCYLDSGEPVANSLDSLDLESTHLDFAAIVEDAETSALLPGSPSPGGGLLLPAAGGANMAVGDMSSMLNTLAGESHFLSSLS
ncbi:zinc finger protein GLI1 [Pterocles gutturalis]